MRLPSHSAARRPQGKLIKSLANLSLPLPEGATCHLISIPKEISRGLGTVYLEKRGRATQAFLILSQGQRDGGLISRGPEGFVWRWEEGKEVGLRPAAAAQGPAPAEERLSQLVARKARWARSHKATQPSPGVSSQGGTKALVLGATERDSELVPRHTGSETPAKGPGLEQYIGDAGHCLSPICTGSSG